MPKLLVITLARKPTVESSVARNSLRWGTGGMNIDGCRIRTSDRLEIHTRGESGLKENRSTYEGGSYYEIPERHQTEGQKIGRWPPNLLLQHKLGCRLTGTKQVGVGEYTEGEGKRPGGFANVGADKGGTKPCGPMYGTETVDAWECEPGCPVHDLDEQSGPSGSWAPATQNRYADPDGLFGSRSGGLHYGDYGGGASRFFKQVKK